MTQRQIELIQTSLEQVLPIADTAAALFYGRLLEIDPGRRPLVMGDVKTRGRALMHTLAAVVRDLKTPDDLARVGETLCRLDGDARANPAPAAVAEAWRWTLRQGLGEAFTAEVEAAWRAAAPPAPDGGRAPAPVSSAAPGGCRTKGMPR